MAEVDVESQVSVTKPVVKRPDSRHHQMDDTECHPAWSDCCDACAMMMFAIVSVGASFMVVSSVV